MIVGAIDFGTSYTGWAFSFAHEFQENPTQVSTKNWYSGSTLMTEKAPTCALIAPDGNTLAAFGYHAENTYRQLAEMKEHSEYYYFKEFKMALNRKLDETFNRNITIEDILDRPLPAMRIFSLTIRFLMKDMLATINNRVGGAVELTDIHLVLTVPAIWTDAAKQFMTEAALQAGISENKLTIGLEPETASVFCRYLPCSVQSVQLLSSPVAEFEAGTKYMVVDAGGGTIDITVHEVDTSGGLTEVHAASGGGWGGTMVNRAFEHFIQDLVTNDVYVKFRQEEMEDWLTLHRDFETKKRELRPSENTEVTIRLPVSLLELIQTETKQTVEELITNSVNMSKVRITKGKLRIDASLVRAMFTSSLDKTTSLIGTLLQEETVHGVRAILMVGGFSDSPLLQHAVRTAFPNLQVIIPRDASTVVLKGAVVFGHSNDAIKGRALKYTYGVNMSEEFIEGVHPEANKFMTDLGPCCADTFYVYANRNDIVKLGEHQNIVVTKPVNYRQKIIPYGIYATQFTPPMVIDDSLTPIGEFTIELDEPDDDLDRKIEFSMSFEKTTITAVARDVKTNTPVQCTLNFLG